MSIIVVSGLPGAGKSTVARRLAERHPRAAHIEADTLQRMIVSGAEWPAADAALNPEAARQLRLRVTNACLLARSYATAGFVAIIDDIFVGERVANLREDLAGAPFRFVMLNPSLDVLHERNVQRTKRDAFEQASALYDALQTQTEHFGIWIDSSTQTPAQTVSAIEAALSES